jgi:hypothetical protein
MDENKEAIKQKLDNLEADTADQVKKELQKSTEMKEFVELIEAGTKKQ